MPRDLKGRLRSALAFVICAVGLWKLYGVGQSAVVGGEASPTRSSLILALGCTFGMILAGLFSGLRVARAPTLAILFAISGFFFGSPFLSARLGGDTLQWLAGSTTSAVGLAVVLTASALVVAIDKAPGGSWSAGHGWWVAVGLASLAVVVLPVARIGALNIEATSTSPVRRAGEQDAAESAIGEPAAAGQEAGAPRTAGTSRDPELDGRRAAELATPFLTWLQGQPLIDSGRKSLGLGTMLSEEGAVLLLFRPTDCNACFHGLSGLPDAVRNWSGQDSPRVAAVAIDTSWQELEGFLPRVGFPFPTYLLPPKASGFENGPVLKTPILVALDRAGRVEASTPVGPTRVAPHPALARLARQLGSWPARPEDGA